MIASLQTTPVTPECPLCYRLTTSAAADKNKASFQNCLLAAALAT